jgi:hypothetical protein
MADDIHEIARMMVQRYGEHAPELMETRSQNCRRKGHPASAAFWQLIAGEVRTILDSIGAALPGYRGRRDSASRH